MEKNELKLYLLFNWISRNAQSRKHWLQNFLGKGKPMWIFHLATWFTVPLLGSSFLYFSSSHSRFHSIIVLLFAPHSYNPHQFSPTPFFFQNSSLSAHLVEVARCFLTLKSIVLYLHHFNSTFPRLHQQMTSAVQPEVHTSLPDTPYTPPAQQQGSLRAHSSTSILQKGHIPAANFAQLLVILPCFNYLISLRGKQEAW